MSPLAVVSIIHNRAWLIAFYIILWHQYIVHSKVIPDININVTVGEFYHIVLAAFYLYWLYLRILDI